MHPLCCSAKFRGLKTPVYLVHSTASSKTPKPPQPHPKISCLTCGTSFLYYSASPKSPESRGLLFQGKQKSFLMGSDLGQVEVSQWQILLSDLWLNSGFRFFFFLLKHLAAMGHGELDCACPSWEFGTLIVPNPILTGFFGGDIHRGAGGPCPRGVVGSHCRKIHGVSSQARDVLGCHIPTDSDLPSCAFLGIIYPI